MNILVTGGAGYIGSTLVPKLLNLGHKVTVVDNFMYNQNPLLECCNNKNFSVINADVRNEKIMKPEVTKADVIIPLACLVGAPLCEKDPWAAQAVNSDVIRNMYNWKSASQMMIYPCTNSGYGIGQDGIFCDENSPLKPISIYGRVKVEAEKHLLDGGEAITFRLATVFGASPRMRLDLLVNDFVYRAINDGFIVLFEHHFKRNFLHVQDATAAFLHAIENYQPMKGKPYNVGLSEANISKLELCETIQKYVPKFRVMISDIGEDPDKRNYIVSNARIEATGFKAKTSLDDGVQELLKVFKIIKRNSFANI
jgi:nucleoside-diphosphate-sugar epimerase